MRTNTTMKLTALAVAMGVVMSSGVIADTNVAGQDVTYEVEEIALLRMDGGAATLTIDTTTGAEAGLEPLDVTAAKTWAITSNAGTDAKKITAVLDADMPANVVLSVQLAPSTGAASPGYVTLAQTGGAVSVLTGIDPVAEAGLAITYKLHATVAAGVVASDTVAVTYTLTDS